MANPALKNGYISVATELVEQFSLHNIPGNEMRLIWVVWRKTWGWQNGDRKKDWDIISFSQFVKATGMKNGNVARSLKELVAKRLLICDSKKGYKFNQNYEEWIVAKRLSPKVGSQKATKEVAKRLPDSSQKATKSVAKRIVTIDKRKLKDKKTPDTLAHDAREVADLIDLFQLVNPAYKNLFGNPPQRRGADRLLTLHPLDYWKRFMPAYQVALDDRFCPKATTPLEMERKLGEIEIYGRQRKAAGKKTNVAFS